MDPETAGPRILPRAEHILSRQNISPEALKVLYGLKEAGFFAYIAGGGVRDLLLGRKPKDFDVVTDATPNQVRRVFRNCRLIGRRFRLAHVFYGPKIIEVATFRANFDPEETPAEEEDAAAAQVHHVRTDDGLVLRDNLFGTPEQDAWRRDFTVNALFYNIADYSVIDYVGGIADLQARRLRFIGEPRTRCVEDPVRMVRAVRFAAALGFELEPAARQAILDEHERLALANRSRLYEEVLKLFFCGAAERAYQLLRELHLFELLFPEMGAWLDGCEGSGECDRIRQAMKQVDTWRGEGREVGPGLLFAMLFGGLHEARAHALVREGHHPVLALHSVTMEHFGGLVDRVQVPKAVRYRTAEIIAAQPRLTSPNTRRVNSLLSRPFYREAVGYLDFISRLRGGDRDRVRWLWELSEGRAPVAEDEPRRRRRRGRRGKRHRAVRGGVDACT
jgi:poly(A) polymerase